MHVPVGSKILVSYSPMLDLGVFRNKINIRLRKRNQTVKTLDQHRIKLLFHNRQIQTLQEEHVVHWTCHKGSTLQK